MGGSNGVDLARAERSLDLARVDGSRRRLRRRPPGAGLRRGDRIGIWSLNRAEWTVTQFAAARAGFILVTINPAYRLSELEFALNKVGCSALVTATAFKNSDYVGMVKTLAPELVASKPGELSAACLPNLRIVIQIGGPQVPGTIAFDEVSARGGAAERAALP